MTRKPTVVSILVAQGLERRIKDLEAICQRYGERTDQYIRERDEARKEAQELKMKYDGFAFQRNHDVQVIEALRGDMREQETRTRIAEGKVEVLRDVLIARSTKDDF